MQGEPIAVLSDSLSAIQTIKAYYKSKNSLTQKIIDEVSQYNQEIVFIWVPSHVGIPGNDKADELAKKSLTLASITNIKIPNQDVKRYIKETYHKQWKTNWNRDNAEYQMRGIEAGIEPNYFQLPRRDQIKITRLALRTTLLTHRHYFTNSTRPVCPECLEDITLEHVLTTCPKYEHGRREMREHCDSKNLSFSLENLTSNSMPPHIMIKFLKECNLYNEI